MDTGAKSVTTTDMATRAAQQSAKSRHARGNGETATAPPRGATSEPERPAARRVGDRWAAFNSFMDVIAPRLTLAERAVWLVMFRHARDGVAQTSERQLATAARIDKATAGRALRRLTTLGLTWPIHKSTNKAMQSKYGIHPNPAACLAGVIKSQEATAPDSP